MSDANINHTSIPLDSTVANVLDRERSPQYDEDEDALLAELENEDAALDAFRERRLQQLHDEYSRARTMRSAGSGGYDKFNDEKTLMDLITFVLQLLAATGDPEVPFLL